MKKYKFQNRSQKNSKSFVPLSQIHLVEQYFKPYC